MPPRIRLLRHALPLYCGYAHDQYQSKEHYENDSGDTSFPP